MKELTNYKSILSIEDTQIAIKFVKDNFEKILAKKLNLTRVSAPLFVRPSTGLNDNLSGSEKAVSFNVKCLNEDVEIVQSLAKWKRIALKRYGFNVNEGLYTDMNAIRKDENIDFIHSFYVDQWDYELIINKEDRNLEFLKSTVKNIYSCLLKISKMTERRYKNLKNELPKEIYFISSEELLKMYPNMTSKERENAITREKKAVFLYQIGKILSNGESHDTRAADYDDWELNGDILLYYSLYDMAFEISSMGIRVDKDSLRKQLTIKNELEKLENDYCRQVLNEEVPFTIGGGIGQSRLSMFMLKKAHIGEVQSSIWNIDEQKELEKKNIILL